MSTHDLYDDLMQEKPAEVFEIISRAINRIGEGDLQANVPMLVEIMNEARYSHTLTCKMEEVAKSSIEKILEDRELSADMVPWRFHEICYLLDIAERTAAVIQSEMKKALGFCGNDLKTSFTIFDDACDKKSGRILHAQYSSGRYRILVDDANSITGFRIFDCIRLNKNHGGTVLRPHKWLSALFHELVHQGEHQIELMAIFGTHAKGTVSPCVTEDDFDIACARHGLKIDKAFYNVAYDLYRATPSEVLAVSTQNIFCEHLNHGLLKLAR